MNVFNWLFKKRVVLYVHQGDRGRWRWTARTPKNNDMCAGSPPYGWSSPEQAIHQAHTLFYLVKIYIDSNSTAGTTND